MKTAQEILIEQYTVHESFYNENLQHRVDVMNRQLQEIESLIQDAIHKSPYVYRIYYEDKAHFIHVQVLRVLRSAGYELMKNYIEGRVYGIWIEW